MLLAALFLFLPPQLLLLPAAFLFLLALEILFLASALLLLHFLGVGGLLPLLAGDGLLFLFLLALQAGFLPGLGLLVAKAADHPHGKEDQGQGQYQPDEEITQHSVDAVNEGQEGGQGNVADRHHVHGGVLLPAVDHSHGTQHISFGDGGLGSGAV